MPIYSAKWIDQEFQDQVSFWVVMDNEVHIFLLHLDRDAIPGKEREIL